MRRSTAGGAIRVHAPAKLNLGLEVLGPRADGFHNLATILQTIALYDTVTLSPAGAVSVDCADPALATTDNLIVRAVERLRGTLGESRGALVHLAKAIPVAAGLGGASSDAAAALLSARALWQSPAADDLLVAIGAEIGSDVPFFFHGGTALATGRGDELAALPPIGDCWFVVVSPRLAIPEKTARLYRALHQSDYSDGALVRAQAARLRLQQPVDPSLLGNAFTRPLTALFPELSELGATMRRAGAPHVALSGAGPSHYTIVTDPKQAARLASTLRAALRQNAQVNLVSPVGNPPIPVAT